MEKEQIILEFIKAITVVCFLFYFYYAFKKAFVIGKALNTYLLINKLDLNAKYKRTLLSKVIFKFFSFSYFEEYKMEKYLEEHIILSPDFLKNLINLKDL